MSRLMELTNHKLNPKPIIVLIVAIILLATLLVTILSAIWVLHGDPSCICCEGLHNKYGPAFLGGLTSTEPRYVWLPDGEEILYQNQVGEIFSVELSGTQAVVRQVEGLEGHQLDVTSDGRLIAFSTKDGEVNIYDYPAANLVLSLQNATGAEWSPDNQTIAFHSSKEDYLPIEVLHLDTPNERIHVAGKRNESYYLESWSNAGDYLALTHTDSDPVAVGLASKFYLLPLDTLEIRPLIDLTGCQRWLSWAPDDNLVAFVANPDITWDLFVAGLNQNEPRNLSNTADIDEYQPAWSPDGKTIAYVSYIPTSETSFEQDIYLIDTETLEVRHLTHSKEYESLPLWSPNGERIAYLSVSDGIWYLNGISVDGSGQERLATIGADP